MIRQAQKPPKRRAITPEDLARFRTISAPQISPDGSRIVFVEKHVGERNEFVSNLWLVDVGRVSAAQFTASGCDCKPQWSSDGTRIAFIRATSEARPQIFTIAAAGGEACQLSDFPEGTIKRYRWSPDGRWLAVSFRRQDPQWTEEAKQERRALGRSEPPRVIEDLWYRYDGEGYFGAQRHALYLVNALSGDTRLLYDQDTLGHFTFDFSPDSRQLVVATNRAKEPTLQPEADELLRIDRAAGRVTPIRGLPPGPKTSVCWSPDGKLIAYSGRIGSDPVYSPENLELFVCHPTRGAARSLSGKHDICLQAEGISDTVVTCDDCRLHFNSDGTRIYLPLSRLGETHVASIPAAGGKLKIHTRGACDIRLGNLSADGRKMALTVGSATTLAEVAVGDCRTGRITMLTNLNGPLLAELQLSEPEPQWVRSADGNRLQLWVIKPARANKSAKGKAPAILGIHGGPHAQYCSSFFHEFQVWAAAGYAVFYANPRGSKGYGREHCAAIRGQWGTADWTDIQAVIGFMKEQPFVDRRRLGVMGGSYGGYLTNWVIGHCRDFAAAVTDRGLCNLVSSSGTTDCIEPMSHYFPGNFWDQSEARWEQSPLKHLGQVKTPTLIIHSEGDLRCSIEQAEQLYTALQLMGVPTRFVRYPAVTSHGMSRSGPADLRIDRLRQILAWWEKHLGHGRW